MSIIPEIVGNIEFVKIHNDIIDPDSYQATVKVKIGSYTENLSIYKRSYNSTPSLSNFQRNHNDVDYTVIYKVYNAAVAAVKASNEAAIKKFKTDQYNNSWAMTIISDLQDYDKKRGIITEIAMNESLKDYIASSSMYNDDKCFTFHIQVAEVKFEVHYSTRDSRPYKMEFYGHRTSCKNIIGIYYSLIRRSVKVIEEIRQDNIYRHEAEIRSFNERNQRIANHILHKREFVGWDVITDSYSSSFYIKLANKGNYQISKESTDANGTTYWNFANFRNLTKQQVVDILNIIK